jgi:hypothetical protein
VAERRGSRVSRGASLPAGLLGSRPASGSALLRFGLSAGAALLFGGALAGPAWNLASLVGASDWGSDWRWLEDGLRRLAAGAPLVRPEYVAAPFSQFPNGPAYTWSLHPPFTATLIAPSLLLPEGLRQPVWTWLMAAAVGAAIWLAWPRRLWRGTQVLVAAVLLGPPFGGVALGLVDQLHFANPNALVVLGVVIAWIGRRHGSSWLVAGGLVLAALKIVPAVALCAWLLARPRVEDSAGPEGRQGIALPAMLSAGAMLVALTLPVLVIDPGVLADTLAAMGNLVPWPGATNLAPGVRLAPWLGPDLATWLSRGAGLGLLAAVLLRNLGGPGGFVLTAAAGLLLTPQLWAHWLLIPAAAALVAGPDWPPLRALDRRLRIAWLGGSASTDEPRGLAARGFRGDRG